MNRFRVQCTLRVLFIGATLMLSAYFVVNTISYAVAAMAGVVVALQLREFIRYVDKSNRDLARLLRSIRYSDFSQTFTSEGRGGSYAELSEAFRSVMNTFRAARAEKEEHYRYLQTVIQHIGVGLVSFKQDGAVGLVNNAAKRLLRVRTLTRIQSLDRRSDDLVEVLLRMRSGDKALAKLVDDDELLQLSLSATEFKMRGDLIKLVSIQDIQSELEEKEIEAWQKLTRVLTHEIMNSITPITSLASTANDLLVPAGAGREGELTSETFKDVQDAVHTIEKRSKSLLAFVNAYRSLTRIPQPDFQILAVIRLFENVLDLLQLNARGRGVPITTKVDPASLTVTADPELVERVLINLVNNAVEAVEGTPDADVELAARLDRRGRSIIQVADNGPGIVAEALDKIFVPFYTTKKEGSGIGLSLSREIMRQHGGTLTAYSEPAVKTVFTMRF
jgi:nitrogen fixation/metabolism regulation signal transduction histidine kinase